jgi:hypothetical protein
MCSQQPQNDRSLVNTPIPHDEQDDFDGGDWTKEEIDILADEAHEMISQGEIEVIDDE